MNSRGAGNPCEMGVNSCIGERSVRFCGAAGMARDVKVTVSGTKKMYKFTVPGVKKTNKGEAPAEINVDVGTGKILQVKIHNVDAKLSKDFKTEKVFE